MFLQTKLLKLGGVSALLATTLAISAPAHALSALSSLTIGNVGSTGASATYGFAFDVLDPNGITVTDLSIYDRNGDGLFGSHDIGLWNSAGTLLTSATASAGTVNLLSANGLFRTVAISSILLPQGANYVVGAIILGGDPDSIISSVTGLTTPSQISFKTIRYIDNNVASLTFPTRTDGDFYSGSFEFVPVVTAVPFEFSPALGLSVLGGLWVGKRLIKKVKAAKK